MAKIQTIDPALIEWATDRQAEYIRAVNKHGGFRQAAKHLGIKHTGILRSVNAVKAKAAMAGYSPEHNMRQTENSLLHFLKINAAIAEGLACADSARMKVAGHGEARQLRQDQSSLPQGGCRK